MKRQEDEENARIILRILSGDPHGYPEGLCWACADSSTSTRAQFQFNQIVIFDGQLMLGKDFLLVS